MILTNTNGKEDVQINELLIERGYAKYYDPFEETEICVSESKCASSYIHTFFVVVYRQTNLNAISKTIFQRKFL